MDVVLKSKRTVFDSLNLEGTNYFAECSVAPGGSGNLSTAITWLGGKSAFVGKAGRDFYGKAYHDDLVSRGVRSKVLFDRLSHTGLAVCLVDGRGRRTMFVSRGANDMMTSREALEAVSQLGSSHFIYLSGYSLEKSPQRDAVAKAAFASRARRSVIVFDPGSSNLVLGQPKFFKRIVDECDILCANLHEARALAGGKAIRHYARALSERGKLVLVKLGPRGCLLAERGSTKGIGGVKSRPVDTTGAGDAFLAAFLYALSRGHSSIVSGSFANWFAAKKTEGLGARNFPPHTRARAQLARLAKR